MIRLIAQWWARVQYVFKEEASAAVLELNSSAALYRAEERRKAAKQMNEQADGIEANIKEVDEKMEKGFWQCEAGHEKGDAFLPEQVDDTTRKRLECKAPAKLIRADLMTGQEKYEAAKERKEAEGMAAGNRAAAKEHEDQIKGNEDAAAMFKKQAKQAREFAELLRKL
jgi:hypothetical protein